MNKAYFETSCLSPAFTDSLQLRDVFSNLSLYKNEMGTKLPFLLHSQPWAALKAAPRDAESVRGKKKEDDPEVNPSGTAQNYKRRLGYGAAGKLRKGIIWLV